MCANQRPRREQVEMKEGMGQRPLTPLKNYGELGKEKKLVFLAATMRLLLFEIYK